MTRIVLLCIFAAGAFAQSAPEPGSLAALEATARQKTSDWEKLAQAMEPSLARMLPCDPKATATITAVSRASEARLSALSAYVQAAERQAASELAASRRVLASAQSM